MSTASLISALEQHLRLKLTHIDGVQTYMDKRYPRSYLDVMTPEEEMAGSMYSRHVFTEGGQLVGLNLYGCEVTDEQLAFFHDPDFKNLLRSLRTLNLSKTKISTFTLSQDLPELVYVTLNENAQLEKVKCERGLSQLARLEITETAITYFHIPPEYDSLYYLDLSKNPRLERFQFGQGGCKNLEVLFLRGTAIKSFTLPEGFDKLVHLYLNDNQLEELHIKSKLPRLSCLQLRNNALAAIDKSILELAPDLHSCFLGKNNLPEELSFRLAEIPDQDHLPILKEYFAQRELGLEKNNECKVLLIGNGKAGKSAIVNRIVNEAYDPEWNSTHGISLLDKDLGEYHLNYWDFGGQDIYHATHRLFMQKNAVYILAWSLETEAPETPSGIFIEQADGTMKEKMYRNHDLRYWLEYAKHLGEGSPMHVVQTKTGLPGNPVTEHPDLAAAYQNDFNPPLRFHPVECADDDPFDNGFDALLRSLDTSVASIKKGDLTIAKPLYEIRKYLRDLQRAGKKTLSLQEYEKKATALQVSSPIKMLETWLFKSGVVYYQPGKFNNEIILDQGWAIEAIYTLFDRSTGVPDKIRASKGVFNGAFVQDIWRKKGYPDQDTHELFISFMKSCDLCFEVRTQEKDQPFRDRVFMVPQLLENERPAAIDDFWEGRETLCYRYADDFIHEGIIHSFISQTAYLAELRGIWQIGIQIKEESQYAWIEAGKNEINIRLTPNAQPLLNKIRRLLAELQGNKGREELSYDGLTYAPFAASERVDPHVRGQKGMTFIPPSESLEHLEETIAPRTDEGFEKDQPLKIQDEAELLAVKDRLNSLEKIVLRLVVPGSERDKDPILFLTSNPHHTTPIRTREEHRIAMAELGRGKERNAYRFEDPSFGITVTEFIRLLDCMPRIIHFAGHGEREGIVLHSEMEQPQVLPVDATPDIFSKLEGKTELVILNACHSRAHAKAISIFGIYVIGTHCSVKDPAALAFTKGFYSALGRGATYQTCFREARAIVRTEYPGHHVFEAWHNGTQLPW